MALQNNEYDETSAETTIGYGGMVVRNGIGWPMPEAEAIAHAIPQWLEMVDDLDDVVALFLATLQSQGDAARIAVLNAFVHLAKHGCDLPRRKEVERAIRAALDDAELLVRAAATAALEALFGQSD
jgi:hypothetical protein